MQFNSGLNAQINIVMDFWSKHWWKNSKSMDFGDFKQIILYFGLSIWTHFEYRIKIITV